MPINTPTGYLDITNATLRGSKIVTTGFVGIANANPTNHLSIGSNLHINDTHSNVLQISGNINAASVVLGGISIAPTFDLEVVTNTGNTTPYTVEFNNAATAFVTTANATIGDTLTASKLVGDGSGISAIQSSNVTDFASNVSRITTLETSRALKSDLNNNSSRITNLSSNLSDNSARITNLSSNLSDNSSRITTLESGDFSISGKKTFTGQVIFESNIHMAGGNVLVANTINMTVSDPIIELGSNNLNTGDLGIVMTRHNDNSNVAFLYDESDDILRIGYTLNGASSSVIYLDSNALAVGVQGTMTADKIVASNVIPATSTTTGALTVAGGVGVDGNVHCSNLYTNNITMNLVSFSGLQTFEQVVNNGRILNSNVLIISNTSPATSSATGCLRLGGGLGVEGNVHIGSNLSVTGDATLSNLSVTGETTLSNLTVTGETVEVANLAVTSGSLELTQVANVFQVKSSSNVVTEYVRSKKLIKYPRVALPQGQSATGASGYTYDGYTIKASSEYPGGGSVSFSASNAFTNANDTWITGASDYSGGLPVSITANTNKFGENGSWLEIKLPVRVKLQYHQVFSRRTYITERIKKYNLWASNTGNDLDWVKLESNTTASSTYTDAVPHVSYINTENLYQYYAIQLTKIWNGGYGNIGEWELYGVPEYDPEAHGTDVIMRSVPNVPNTDWLEVYYDGQDYTSMPSTVTDKSGNGVNGTPTGVTFDSEYKAFTFDGSGDIRSTVSTFSGDQPHTMSTWVYISSALNTADAYICVLAPSTGENLDQVSTIRFQNDGFNVQSWGNDIQMYNLGIQKERWYHLTVVYDGGGVTTTSKRLYINGVQNLSISGYTASGNTINFTNTTLSLGSRVDGSGSHLKGSIANFRLFNRALTGDEIWQLYAYQKEYFDVSPDVVTFKGGRLGIGTEEPRAVLDVRGSAVIDRTYTLVDNIVAQYIVPSNSEFVHIPNLDLDGDGGTYKIVISLKNATTNNPNMSMYINDVSTSASYYSKRTQHTSGSSLSNTNGEYIFGLGNSSEHHHEFTLSRHAISGYPICTGTGMFHTGTTKSSGAVQGWDLHAWVYYGNVNVTKLSFQTYPHNAIATGSIFTIYKYL